MGRAAAVVAAISTVLLGAGSPALAQPSPSPSPGASATASPAPVEVPEAVPGEQQCTTDDYRLQALSGMVARDDGYVVVNDGSIANVAFDGKAIFFLTADCQIEDQIPLFEQRDPEDLAYDSEQDVLWAADTGDNFQETGFEERPTVALWRVELEGDRIPVIHRFAYPDGAKDAEALVLDGDGTPIIVTREVNGEPAGLYRPASEMVPNNPHDQAVPLERVGEFSPTDTGTPHALGRLARQVVTGGANSPDGTHVALRTLTDAFEFDVTDGDVVAAITSGEFRITPLPDEPQGESITYSPDGEYFLTVSDTMLHDGVDPVILRYTPTEPAPEPSPTAVAAQEPAPDNRSLLDRLGPQGLLNIVAAVGGIGLVMVAVGVFGIVRARRQAAEGIDGEDPEEIGAPVTARARVAPPSPDPHPPEPAPPDPQPGWEPDYPGGYPGYPAHGGAAAAPAHGGAAADPAPQPGGTVYSAGGVARPDQPYDQDYPDGYPGGGYPANGYPGGGYPADRYPADGYPADGYPADGYPADGYADQQPGGYHPQPPPGGTYSGGVYQSRQDDVPDYYSDDADYPYEFRDRDRW